MSAVRIVKLAGAVVLAGVAGTIYYILRKKLDTDWGCVEVAVPVDVVGRFIGRKGASVKLIEAKTQTKIHFKETGDKNGSHRTCVIAGPSDRLWMARSLVDEAVQKLSAGPTMQYIEVPAQLTGGIIGSRGHRINDIMHTTCTRITVERRGDAATHTSRRVEVRGSKEGVEAAIALLQDRVQSLLQEGTRRSVTSTAPSSRSLCSSASQDLTPSACMVQPEHSSSDVYVCSVSSATSLYVQLVSSKLDELNMMVDEMTSFYSDPANRLPASTTRLGIVAAPYPLDNRWYRAWQVGHHGKDDETRMKKRYNPSQIASVTKGATNKYDALHNNNNEEEKQTACHSKYYSSSEIVSSIQGNVPFSNLESDSPTECDTTLIQCDSSLNPQTKCTSDIVDHKTDVIQTVRANSNSPVGCDASSLDLMDDNLGSNHSNNCSARAISQESSPTALKDHSTAKPSAAEQQQHVQHTAVFFADYGDYALVPSADLCDLRTDFLSLGHQAFLVRLAGVAPVEGRNFEAQYHLSNLTRCSEWQPISAKIVGYQHNSSKSSIKGDQMLCTNLLNSDNLSNNELCSRESSIKTELSVLYSMLEKIVSEEGNINEEEELDYESFQNYDTIALRLYDSFQMLNNLTCQLRLRENLLTLSQLNQMQHKTDTEEERISQLIALTNELRVNHEPSSGEEPCSSEDHHHCSLTEEQTKDTAALVTELTNKIEIVKKKHHLYQLVQRILCCGESDLKSVGTGPVPLVQLFVTVDGEEVDVIETMVREGLLQCTGY